MKDRLSMTLLKKTESEFMAELTPEILAEKENIDKALKNLSETMKRPEKTVIELAAAGTFLHNFYSGIENVMKQAADCKVISPELAEELCEYLVFRHFFVHSLRFQT